MTKQIIFLLCALIMPTLGIAQKAEQDTFRLYYLGGQSNMDGFGYNTELHKPLDKENKDVWIFHGNPAPDGSTEGGIGFWDTLKPGHGRGFSSDSENMHLSSRFGVELSLATKLQSLYPNEKIALIKYSRGGTSIHSLAAGNSGCWEPDFKDKNGINQYDHCLKTLHQATGHSDINGDGKKDILIPCGIVWMQGESDASYNEDIAQQYYANLKRLMDLIRAGLHQDNIPVVIGKISDSWDNKAGKVWPYGELIQYAQEKYARTDANASIVRMTRYYKYSDRYHYDSEGYIDLGEKFAEAIYRLDNK